MGAASTGASGVGGGLLGLSSNLQPKPAADEDPKAPKGAAMNSLFGPP